MKILIDVFLVIILFIVWGIFYQKNIKNKDLSLKSKILIIVSIVIFNGISLYLISSVPDRFYFTEFGKIEITTNIENLSKFLKSDGDYEKRLKEDLLRMTSKALIKHSFKFNPKSENKIDIKISDEISYLEGKTKHNLKIFFLYPFKEEKKEITVFTPLNTRKLSYKKFLSIYQGTINQVLNSIFYAYKIKDKTKEELVHILTHKFNLPDIYYVRVFNELISKEEPPKLEAKVLLRYLNNPTTFSEATGYAIITDNCDVINEIIDRSLYFDYSTLESMLAILTQSHCKSVKGYLTVLKSSRNSYLSGLASKYLKEYMDNQKRVFDYTKGNK